MTIGAIDTWRFDLPLVRPLTIGGKTISRRSGILISLIKENGLTRLAEVSPLPGLHSETIPLVMDQIKRIRPRLEAENKPPQTDIAVWLDDILPPAQWYPTLRFALEDLLDDRLPDSEAGKTTRDRRVHVNSLIMDSSGGLQEAVDTALAEGYRALKLKVGRLPLAEEIRAAQKVISLIAGKAVLRLDANRTWDMPEALCFLNAARSPYLEYIEEPLRDASGLTELFQKSTVPFALDENLPVFAEAGTWPQGMAALIIKPTVIGSLARCRKIAAAARKKGIKTVISDTFQSGIGLAALVRLAAALDTDTPMGLDTYRLLQSDILKERPRIQNGAFSLSEVVEKSAQVDFSRLQKI